MPRQLFVSLLPSLLDASRLAGGSAVVIDVLRASTTVCAALHAGAARVVPFASVDDARRFADRLAQTSGGREPSESPLLGGERHGVKIDGFDLGNSPLEYTKQKVSGRTVVFTTTNGTRALLAAGAADRIYMGAFANLNPLCDQLAKDPGNIHLICAGTDGQVTLEDAYAAGEIALTLLQKLPNLELGNDEAAIAIEMVQGTKRRRARDSKPAVMFPQPSTLNPRPYDSPRSVPASAVATSSNSAMTPTSSSVRRSVQLPSCRCFVKGRWCSRRPSRSRTRRTANGRSEAGS